jgi:hypothetical protein
VSQPSLPQEAQIELLTGLEAWDCHANNAHSGNKIDEVKSNLPLPEQPPKASDWNSADERNVNVGSGGNAASGGQLRDPATGGSAVRADAEALKTNTTAGGGREAHDNLGGIPNDAVTREAKHKSGTVDTTGKDYGYPQKSDPSSGLK